MRVTTAKLIKRFLEFLMGNNCTLPCRSAPNELPSCAKPPSHEQFHSRDVTAVVGYKKRHGLAISSSVPNLRERMVKHKGLNFGVPKHSELEPDYRMVERNGRNSTSEFLARFTSL